MTPLSMKQSELKQNLIRKRQPCIVGDSIAAMRAQEETTYRVHDFLAYFKGVLNEDCREKMSVWSFQIADFCGLSRGTVAISMNFLDRFMHTEQARAFVKGRKHYQLAAMTTLYMAVKIFEPLQMDAETMAIMSRGCYNSDQILHMERIILDSLKWRTQGPTALCFVQHFMELLPSIVHPSVSAAIMEQARYQTELAVLDYELVRENQSEVALASILNALAGLDEVLLSSRAREEFINAIEFYSNGITCDKVEPVRQYLEHILIDVIQTSIQSVMEARVLAFYNEKLIGGVVPAEEWPTTKANQHKEASPVCISRQ
eukprot:CAMPEP_0118693260 /NCGR_PEP_ID=MMETSP0800-20121206/11804_1 /TAXON_ID=210618 ORGANISM="Striatella unipunctata, Strain CCMP2910" /NCGR_SAMPLE_ID=MMETSP0800 /ASSEMBLY_ACC=CAM_ASM_000638 /LENGTH=315 /DNA_ID=CAMNT_0006591465 /DNA_START=68 /DNA_END=1015 /DNA_ORIENTATION=-